MPSPSPEVALLAAHYRLVLPESALRGTAGDRLGRGTGASIEFQDRRSYAPGDDLRHLDWRAYARTDQLLVRLFREEVSPRAEILLDASRSMEVGEAKARAALDLAAFLASLAEGEGLRAAVLLLGESVERLDLEALRAREVAFSSTRSLGSAVEESTTMLRPGAVRFFVSDFLAPVDPAALVRPLALRAGSLVLVQLLSRQDREPLEGAALRLTDCETDEFLDLVLDPRTVALYRDRLRRLGEALDVESRRVGGGFLSLDAEASLAEICRTRLVPATVIEPR